MMDNMISIIIPAYNMESYIERCLKSVTAQTYTNLEIIVVDDGSKDSTGLIARRMAENDKRIIVLHQENAGVTTARLNGVSQAHGEWIGFVDGDDMIDPEMYDLLLGNALKYNAEISHCGYKMVFPSRVDYYYGTGRLAKQDKSAALKELLDGSIEPGLWNKLFHKTLLHRWFHNKWMDESVKNMEDFLMNYYLFRECGTSVFEDVCPYHYIVRKGSATSAGMNIQRLTDPLKVFKMIMEQESTNIELRTILEGRIAAQLISLSTQKKTGITEFDSLRTSAREELRSICCQMLKNRKCEGKMKMMVLWACIWPGSYGVVHRRYVRLLGRDKKYEVR